MTVLLRAEALKLRTTRAFAVLVADAAVATMLLVVLGTAVPAHVSANDARTLFSTDMTGLFALLVGAMSSAGEWRHRTIAGSVLAAPDRVRLLAAKAGACAGASAALSVVVSASAMIAGTLILQHRGLPTLGAAVLADLLWRNVVIAAVLGAIGVAVGALVRHQVVAIAGLLVTAVVLEPAVMQAVPGAGRFGPLVGAPSGIAALPRVHDVLAPALALAVSVAWAGAAFAAAAIALRRRDLV